MTMGRQWPAARGTLALTRHYGAILLIIRSSCSSARFPLAAQSELGLRAGGGLGIAS
jgi:hypothetical protein